MLLWQFLRFVEVMRPKYFLMENVRGLLSAAIRHRPIADRPNRGGAPLRSDEEPGSVVDLWVQDLVRDTEGDYRVDCFEVNAVNYGAPQIRERVFFIGNRLGRQVDFPEPTHINPYGSDQPSLLDSDKKFFSTLGDALEGVEDPGDEILDFSPRKKSFLAQVPEGSNWRALPVEVHQESMGRAWHAKGGRSGWWRRLSRDLPSPTVVTMPNHASTSMCHPTETRALTLKECAAIQGFPSDWEFCGTTSKKYAQVGNAIPIRLGEVAGETLAEELDLGEPETARTELPIFRKVYLNSHVRTRQWYKAGQIFAWKDGASNADAHYSARGRIPTKA
jgi:DNA (cytosine-5)-methyltransferase 1